jgi:hypothetical protein
MRLIFTSALISFMLSLLSATPVASSSSRDLEIAFGSPRKSFAHQPQSLEPRQIPADPYQIPGTNITFIGECIYNVTGDMYGLGVRIGFYLQSASCIVSNAFVVRGNELNRGTNAIMTLPLTVAYGLGFLDQANILPLEVQMFISLVAMVALPCLSVILLRRSTIPGDIYSNGSIVSLTLIFVVACGLGTWGEATQPYHGACRVFSGLGGDSVKAKAGWSAWLALLCTLTATALSLFLISIYRMWRSVKAFRHGFSTSTDLIAEGEQCWFREKQRVCICWLVFIVGLWCTCVASVELTLKRHLIITDGLSQREFGQWIALCVGICSWVSLLWAAVGDRWKWRKPSD